MMKQEEVSEEAFTSNLDTLYEASKLAMSNLMRAADLVRSFKRTSIDQASEQSRSFNMKQLITDVQTNLHNQFKNTQIRIGVDCPEKLDIKGYPGLLHQLLTNLFSIVCSTLSTMAKAAGEIKVVVTQLLGDRLSLNFPTTGKVCQPRSQPRCSSLFLRHDAVRVARVSGCTSVTTSPITQLHGSLTCHSVPGQGASLTLSSPILHPKLIMDPDNEIHAFPS